MSAVPLVPRVPPTAIVRMAQRLQRGIASAARSMGPPPFTLLELVMSRWISDALCAITRLGVADALSAGPRTSAALAAELSLHEASLYRVLRALAREGLLLERPDATFALTELSAPLASQHPNSMRNMVLEVGRQRNVEVWARLHESVRDGQASWGRVHEEDMWAHLDAHPEEHAVFHGAMRELTREAAPAFARALDYGAFSSICDIGGGEGQLLATILTLHPKARGVLVDAPRVVAGAAAVLSRHGVEGRCDVVAGDILRDVPRGHGLYLAKNIVHGLSDELARGALSLWRQAMPDGGRLALIEVVVPDGDRPYLHFLDLQMLLVSMGGRERTRAEFEALLASSGLSLERVIETPTPMSMVVARAS